MNDMSGTVSVSGAFLKTLWEARGTLEERGARQNRREKNRAKLKSACLTERYYYYFYWFRASRGGGG